MKDEVSGLFQELLGWVPREQVARPARLPLPVRRMETRCHTVASSLLTKALPWARRLRAAHLAPPAPQWVQTRRRSGLLVIGPSQVPRSMRAVAVVAYLYENE